MGIWAQCSAPGWQLILPHSLPLSLHSSISPSSCCLPWPRWRWIIAVLAGRAQPLGVTASDSNPNRSSRRENSPWDAPLSRFFSFAVVVAQEQLCAAGGHTPVWGAKGCPPPGLALTLSPPLPCYNNIPFFFPAVLWIPPAGPGTHSSDFCPFCSLYD